MGNEARIKALKGKHGDGAEAMVAVEEAVAAAGSDVGARFKAGIGVVLANAQTLKNPHDQRAALDHFATNLDGFIDLCVTGVPKG